MITERLAPGAALSPAFIPLTVPELRGKEWEYVKECLDTGWVSSVGSFVERFEKEIAKLAGSEFAVATVNGTCALHTALLVAGVRPDDEVLVSTLTFIAPANAIRYVGAWPVLIDAESDYWQMNPARVEEFLEKDCVWNNGALRRRATGRRVSAIMPVHILGHPVDLDPILELARKYELRVIEDATESLGARYRERPIGSLGDLACFSFNGNKMITTGGGGMLVTSKEDWAHRAKYLTTQAKDDPLEYVHGEIGYNYRLTNLQAALGCAQLEQLDNYVATKRRITQAYNDAFRDLPGITLPQEAPWAFATNWMYTFLVDETGFGMNSRQLMRSLHDRKIQTRPLWQPLHQSPAHQAPHSPEAPVAEEIHARALSLPCSVGLSAEDQSRVIEAILALARH